VPEIWLNYGMTDVVLDIKAENLDQRIEYQGPSLDETTISERLDAVDITKPLDLVVLNYTEAVRKTLLVLYDKCAQKSLPKPKIFADKQIMNLVKMSIPQDGQVLAFEGMEKANPDLVFVSEMEFDGLFGFDAVCTRLLRRFGKERMLDAYEKRQDNVPHPGKQTSSIEVAKSFTSSFEIASIEIAAHAGGIADIAYGHPSNTISVSRTMESFSKAVEPHRTLLISTGKDASNETLGKTLGSLWNCYRAIRDDGLAMLLGECKMGVGSEAIRQFIEGRMSIERLQKPAKYVDGMEDLLYLSEVQKKIKVGLVSILPQMYVKKLGMISFDGVNETLEYILKNQGARQKVSIVADGARILVGPQ
jgi:hypothetical protein